MNKPTLTLLSSTEATSRKMYDQCQEIFGEYLDIAVHWVSGLAEGQQISADLVLLTYHTVVDMAEGHLAPGTKTLVARRSISFESIQKLYDIPKGAHVVIANVDRESTVGSLEQIRDLGVNHLEYFPYYPGIEWPEGRFKYAVIFGESGIVGDRDITTIDLGTRGIDLTTCTLIAQHFGILTELREKIENTFMKSNIKLSYSYFEQLSKNLELSKNLQTILNYYEKSTLLMNETGEFLFYNYRAQKLLKITDGTSPYNQVLLDHFLRGENGFFLEIDEENYYVEFYYVSGNSNIVIVISDIENIETINNKYKNRLKASGLVAEYEFADIISSSAVMDNLIKKAKQFAKSDSTIHISGESGCGKELMAQAIHNASRRRNEAFVAINFAALSATLSEAELFGYVEGAFTGAKKGGDKGLFELADKGTIFLDEIGDCSRDIQKKILRVIQERKVMPIGSNKWIPIDIRIISATNQDLSKLVSEKKFRSDLYYRLNVLPLSIPPLRERKQDILPLFYAFLNRFNVQVDSVGTDLEEWLLNYNWQGNGRELRNVAEYIANCINAGIDDWQEEVKERLVPREDILAEGQKKNHALLAKLETECEINSLLAVLETLSTPPYLWTRRSLNQQLPEIGENIIKKIVLILNKYDLAISKKGEGTRITMKGRETLENAQRRQMI